VSLSTDSIRRGDPAAKERGSILIAVLAITFLSTVMLFQFVEEAVQELQYRGQIQNDPDMEAVAYSALEVTLGVLHEFRTIDEKLVAPGQGWGNPLQYAQWEPPEGYSVQVAFDDESSKIALSSLDENKLSLLFELMGFDFRDSEMLTDTLLDWQDEDDKPRINGAEIDTYTRYEPPYRPPNRQIQSWDELKKVDGFRELFFDETMTPNSNFERFTSNVSLLHDQKINLNHARPLTMEYVARLENFDPRALQDYLDGRNRISQSGDNPILFDYNSGYYSPPEEEGVSVATITASLLRIRVWCRRGDAELLIDTLIHTSESDTSSEDRHIPFTIHSQSKNLKIL